MKLYPSLRWDDEQKRRAGFPAFPTCHFPFATPAFISHRTHHIEASGISALTGNGSSRRPAASALFGMRASSLFMPRRSRGCAGLFGQLAQVPLEMRFDLALGFDDETETQRSPINPATAPIA